jgi:hypothetical protein
MVQALPWRVPKNILFLTLFHFNREQEGNSAQQESITQTSLILYR